MEAKPYLATYINEVLQEFKKDTLGAFYKYMGQK